MSQKFRTGIDLLKHELLNAVIQNLSADPTTPGKGQIFYDTDDDRAKLNIGTPGVPDFKKILIEGDGSSTFAGLDDTDRSGLHAYYIGKVIEVEYEQILDTYIQPTYKTIREDKTKEEID